MAFNKSFACADVKIGDIALYYRAQKKKNTPRQRGPALILDIDETGVTAKSQTRIFEVARFCVGKKGGEGDAVEGFGIDFGNRRNGCDGGVPVANFQGCSVLCAKARGGKRCGRG